MSMAIDTTNSTYAVNTYGTGSTSSSRSADAPSSIAISENMASQIAGYNQGSRNADDGQGLIKTADSALSSISESLARMREIAVKASSSALYSDDDKAIMQQEVEQLKQGITDISKNTQFNTKHLLDGSMADIHLATNPQGGGLSIHTEDATLENLGIKDFDVTGRFDIKDLDDAINTIDSARASLGGTSSALTYSSAIAGVSSENLSSASSSIENLDIPKYVSDKKKDEVMEQYQYFVDKQKKAQEESIVTKLMN